MTLLLDFTNRFDVMEVGSSDISLSAALFLAVGGLLFASCGFEKTQGPVVLDATVDTSLVIGADAGQSPESVLGSPVGVAIDGAGHVYVADRQIPAIKVYDDTGGYLRTIGRKGQGPGEFQRITDLHVHEDTLTVICATEVEQFRLDGRPLDTHPLPDRALWQTLRHPDGQWIFGASSGRDRPDSLLRVYTGTFTPTEAAFGRGSEFVDENPVSGVTVAQHVGSLGVTQEGGLLFAPYLYEGEVAEYVRTDGAWTRADTWRGYVERGAYDYEKVSADAPAEEAQIHTSFAGVFNAMYYNKSLGLFRRGGRVFHFTSIARGDHRLFGAEVYAPNGEMQEYVLLEEVATDEDGVPTEVTPDPEAVGPNGTFFLIEKGYGTVPRVVVLSLTVEGSGTTS